MNVINVVKTGAAAISNSFAAKVVGQVAEQTMKGVVLVIGASGLVGVFAGACQAAFRVGYAAGNVTGEKTAKMVAGILTVMADPWLTDFNKKKQQNDTETDDDSEVETDN